MIRAAWLAIIAVSSAACGSKGPVASGTVAGGRGSLVRRRTDLRCGSGCTVGLTELASIRPPNDTTDFSHLLHVAIAPGGGHYVIGPSTDGSEVYVFDSGGALIRTIGRRGQGPGEFRWIAGIAVGQDSSVTLFDLAERRWATVRMDGTLLRTVPANLTLGEAFLSDGGSGIVMNAGFGTRDLFGLVMHHFSPDGHRLSSFDGRTDTGLFEWPVATRVAALRHGGGVWVSEMDRPSIEAWSLAGKALAAVNLEWPWFPDKERGPAPLGAMDALRPEPLIRGVGDDGAGHLLLLIERARPDWKPSREGLARGRREGGPTTPAAQLNYVQFRLEIARLPGGQELGGVDLTGFFPAIVAGNVLVQLVPDKNDRLSVRLLAVDVQEARLP